MKILYIDLRSQLGHTNFNRIHINALSMLGNVYCVFNKGYFQTLLISNKNIKDFSFLKRFRCLKNIWLIRLFEIIYLFIIKIKIKPDNFDVVIFSSYDFFVMPFFKIRNSYLINHNNIPQLGNKIKFFLFNTFANNYVHLVFNDYMRQGLEKYVSSNRIEIVPHGYCNHFTPSNSREFKEIIERYNFIIFCPSVRSIDPVYVSSLLDEKFMEYINRKNILLIIKRDIYASNLNKNIISIDRLTDEQYRFLFTSCNAVLLPYRSDFGYRTSGVLFECFANNIPAIIHNIPSLKNYSKYFLYDPFFDNSDNLIKTIDFLFKGQDSRFYSNIKEQEPHQYWKRILSKH